MEDTEIPDEVIQHEHKYLRRRINSSNFRISSVTVDEFKLELVDPRWQTFRMSVKPSFDKSYSLLFTEELIKRWNAFDPDTEAVAELPIDKSFRKMVEGVICLVVMVLLLLLGIQMGKQSETKKLKDLGLYPTKNEILHAENYIFKGDCPSFIEKAK